MAARGRLSFAQGLASALVLGLCCITSNAGANGFPDITPDFSSCIDGQAVGTRFVCDGLLSATTDSGGPAIIVNNGTPLLCGHDGVSPCSGSLVLEFDPPMSSVTFEVHDGASQAVTAFDALNGVVDAEEAVGVVTLSGGAIVRVVFASALEWGISGLFYHPTSLVNGCTSDCSGTEVPVDTDGDTVFDDEDEDDDNDGVIDFIDRSPQDPTRCTDADGDTCDDCSIGDDGFGDNPDHFIGNDGPDTDADGICDAGDDLWRIESEQFWADPESDDECALTGGGVRFVSGRDTDGNGLDPSEIVEGSTVVVCLPAEGVNMITHSEPISPDEPESPCPANGGVWLTYVVDLDDDELPDVDNEPVVGSQILCSAPHSLTITEPLTFESETCPQGGFSLRVGLDLDSDGEFSGSESYGQYEICNGLDSLILSTPLEPDLELCPTGGFTLEVGTDLNDDGDLSSEDEEESSAVTLCNGLDALILSQQFTPNPEFCPTGGFAMASLTDTEGDGEVESEDELELEPHFVCNGLDSLMQISSIASESELCPSGGALVRVGTDEDADYFFDDELEDSTATAICHGLNSLMRMTELAPSANVCPMGGTVIEVGLDDDGDDQLDDDEVESSETVCNGENSLTKTSNLAPGPTSACPSGGTLLEIGTDHDGDGQLSTGEVTVTRQLCNTVLSVSRRSALSPGSSTCPQGGTQVDTGLDTNGNGVLDDDEVKAEQFLCQGQQLVLRRTRLEHGESEACPGGGVLLEQGRDGDGDGELDDAEVETTEPLCDAFDAIFSNESLPEGDANCLHGGMRVRTGHDDGLPSGTAGDGVLQVAEAEFTRDVCLAGSDVVVDANSAECSVAPGRQNDGTRWATLCTLLVLGVMAARRRGSKLEQEDRSEDMKAGDEGRVDARWFGRGRAKMTACLLGGLSLVVAASANADTITSDFLACATNTPLGSRLACNGLISGDDDGAQPELQPFTNDGESPNGFMDVPHGRLTLNFSPPISRFTFTHTGIDSVTAFDAEDVIVDTDSSGSSPSEVTGSGITRIFVIGNDIGDGEVGGFAMWTFSYDTESPVPGCASDCSGDPLVVDTDGDTQNDDVDLDDDNDGVLDEDEPSTETVTDPDVCGDSDNDGCDDCAIGSDGFGILSDATPLNDGPDGDSDGSCDVANRVEVLFAGCGDETFLLNENLACDGIESGSSSSGDGQPFVQAGDGIIRPSSTGLGTMTLVFSVPVSRFAFTSIGAGAGEVVAWNAGHSLQVDTEDNTSAGTVVLTGGNILSVDFAGGEGAWGIQDLVLDYEVEDLVLGCAPTCDGQSLLDTDGDTTPDYVDTDDDNDGVADEVDPVRLNPHRCGDSDADSCDDCTIGSDQFGLDSDVLPNADGPDGDFDGVCDAGDNRPLVLQEELEPGAGPCGDVGGTAIITGVDRDGDGDLAQGGELEPREIENTVFVCDGADGLSTVATWEDLEPGDVDCPAGGVNLILAFDTDYSFDFDIEEDDVYANQALCNGANSLILSEEFPAGDGPCANGGVSVSLGTDMNSDGALTLGEEPAEYVICHGIDSLIETTPIAPESELCPTGGYNVVYGSDLDGDGEISGSEEEELSTELQICNGLNGLIITSPIEPNEEICAAGGVHVEFGTDMNNDGELNEGDRNYSDQVVCNGHDSLIEVGQLEPSPFVCPRGGYTLTSGTDLNGNGELDLVEQLPTPSFDPVLEINSTRNVCHGLNSLVKTTALEPDPLVCPTGGVKIEVGTDYNGNGELDEIEQIGAPVEELETEIASTEVLCHGLDGVTKSSALEPDAAICPSGGVKVELGTDDDGDGVLDANEVEHTRNVCNALSSLSRTSVLEPDADECPYGGTRLETGLDSDGDHELADDEVLSTEIQCSGSGLAMRSTRLPKGDEDCPGGGMLVESGIDTDGDKTLDDDEIQGRETLCDAINALFDTETLSEDETVCPHGGIRVKIGRDDGLPTGTAANAALEDGEVEVTRDVCLAETEVLVNGGSSECSVSPGAGNGSTRAYSALTLLVLGAALGRRRSAHAARGGRS